MSLKLVAKQHRLNTPSRTNNANNRSKTASSLVSRTPTIPLMNVSVGEHRRVLAKNETITKENALLKQQLRQLKTDLLCAKSKQTNNTNQTGNEKLTFDSFMTALGLMNKINEYVTNGLEDLEADMDSMRTIMWNCESVLRQNYPRYYAEFQQNNGHNIAESGGDSRSSSQRFSMSTERRQTRRKSLLDTIKQAFHAFTELSTIIEMSKELRVSSGNFSESSVRSARVTNNSDNQSSNVAKKTALSDNSNTRSDSRLNCEQRFAAISSRESNKENINPNESAAPIALSPPLHSSSPNHCSNDSENLRAELESMRFDDNDEQCSVLPNNPIDFDLSSSDTLPRRSKRTAKKRIAYEELAENVDIIADNKGKNSVAIDAKLKLNSKQTRKRNVKKTVKKTVQFAISDSFSDELPSVYDFSDETPHMSNSFAEYRRTLANKLN